MKIKCNIDNKNIIINHITNCIDKIDDINKILYNTNIPNDFKYKSKLKDLQTKLINDKEKLFDYKNDFNKFVNEINKNELELNSKINKIEEIIIEKF